MASIVRTGGTAAFALASVALASAASPPAAERVVAGDRLLPVTVAGGTGRLRIDPSGTGMPTLNPDLAQGSGLRGGMFGVMYRIGPISVHGRTAVTRIDLGGGPVKRRVAWFDRPFASGADGVIGPGGLPDPVIRFQLHDPRPGEHTLALPMVDAGGLMGGWSGLFAEVQVGGQPVRVRFDLLHRTSTATAGAGARIAAANGGALDGAVVSADIAFGVERPLRRMRLATPLQVGPLSLGAIHVRIADFGSAAAIPEAGADPDEAIVTAGKKHDPSHDRLTLGLDQLEACSSIVFDKPAKVVRLSCS